MTANVQYKCGPMNCCGLMEGWGFSDSVADGTKKIRYGFGGEREVTNYRNPNQQDHEDRLTQLISVSTLDQKNCVMIVLSDDQKGQIEAAQKLGFKTIQTFWNPNSGNNCHIMTYLHFDSHDEYDGEWD